MYTLENEEFLKFNVEFFRKNLRGLRFISTPILKR